MYELTGQVEELLGQRAKGSGINASFSCPWHEDRNPSLSVHLEEGLFYCFSCGEKGNLERLYKLLGKKLTEEERQDLLVRSVFKEPEPTKNFAPLANDYGRSLAGRAGQSHWKSFTSSRPISNNAATHFRVGYSEKKTALCFPYWQPDDTVSAIRYRYRDGSKSSEDGSKRSIFNVTDIVGAPVVVLAEGESDTMALWSLLPGTVAVCGSPGAAVSERTWANWGLDFLFARKVFTCFDNDEAGQRGAEIARRVLGEERCTNVVPTKGIDISDHLLAGGTLGEIGLCPEKQERKRQTPQWYD